MFSKKVAAAASLHIPLIVTGMFLPLKISPLVIFMNSSRKTERDWRFLLQKKTRTCTNAQTWCWLLVAINIARCFPHWLIPLILGNNSV
jgi:hypothetical protein